MDDGAGGTPRRSTMVGVTVLTTPFVVLAAGGVAGLSWAAAGGVAILVLAGLHVTLEKIAPLEATPPHVRGEALRDAWHGALSLATSIGGLVGGWCLTDALVGAATGRTSWPADGVATQLGMALVVALLGDLLFYWHHRLSHATNGVWWRMHAVHHSITHFNVTHGARAHPFEPPMVYALYGAVGALLGFPFEPTMLGVILGIFVTASQHINVATDIGPLRRLFVSTEHHRWHHDIDAAPSVNYANVFSFWDVLFGTYRNPAPYRGELGMRGIVIPPSLRAQLGALSDARWSTFERAAAAPE
jgi:sterol desaturase/sphingolipid hydroxylase (fatty acid hydroxylase superfamily)